MSAIVKRPPTRYVLVAELLAQVVEGYRERLVERLLDARLVGLAAHQLLDDRSKKTGAITAGTKPPSMYSSSQSARA